MEFYKNKVKLEMRDFCEQLFLHHNILIHLAQIYVYGNSRHSYLSKMLKLPKCNILWAFKLPLRTLSSKLRTFSMVKSKTIRFLRNGTQQYTQVPFQKIPYELLLEKELLSDLYVAYYDIATMYYHTQCMRLHYVHFENHWNLLEE